MVSGGSIKTLMILGALQYGLDSELLESCSKLCGTSAGAIILYLYSIGYSPLEMITYACTHPECLEFDILNLASITHGKGAMRFTRLNSWLETMTIQKLGYLPTLLELYEQTGYDLIVTTYNYTQKESVFLRASTHPTLPCLIALRMSCAIPLLFDAVQYMGQYYIDHGIIDSFPVHHVMKTLELDPGSHIFGVVITPTDTYTAPPENVLTYLHSLLAIPAIDRVRHNVIAVESDGHVIDLVCLQTDVGYLEIGLSTVDRLNLFSDGYSQSHAYFTNMNIGLTLLEIPKDENEEGLNQDEDIVENEDQDIVENEEQDIVENEEQDIEKDEII